MDKVDVLVVGAGPCGCAAALTFLRYARCRVALIEGGHHEHPRVGETVSAALRPLLDFLGASTAIDAAACTMPGYSSRAAWGVDDVLTRDSLFSGRGANQHLDRRRFDATLAHLVAERGGLLAQGAWLRRIERCGDKWRVQVEEQGSERVFEATQVIDATGRRAAFARRAGAEIRSIDSLVAVVQRWRQPDARAMERATLVESCETGWWYGAPLPDGHGVLAFMTDADLLKRLRLTSATAFDAALAQTRSMRKFVHGRTHARCPAVTPAGSQVLSCPVGEAWVAAGDAALAIDPLSSLGIGRAIASGIEAARIVDERLHGGDELASGYVADTRAHLDAFLTQRRAIYGDERRWPDSLFWQRRRDPLSVARMALAS